MMAIYRKTLNLFVASLALCLTLTSLASSPAAAQEGNASAAPASASLFVPKVTAQGAVFLPIADENAPAKFCAAFAFKGDCWNKTPDKAGDSARDSLSVSGPALIASGGGKGEVVFEFKVTPEMKTLQFYLLGNGDRNMVSAALYLNGAEWCMTGIESPKTPLAINWKLEGNAGKTARLVLSKNTPSRDYLLIAAATPEALRVKVAPAEVRTAVSKYHIEKTFVKTVRATMPECVRAPQLRKGDIRIYAPIPPNLPIQQLKEVTLVAQDFPNIKATRTTDVKNPRQEYLLLVIPASQRTAQNGVNIVTEYVIDLYSVRLKRGKNSDGNPLDHVYEKDLGVYTSETSVSDFNSPAFQMWLNKNNLIKGSEESDLDFSYRAFQFIAANVPLIPIPTPFVLSLKASKECYIGVSGCGETANVYSSVLAANKVPVMTLAGRYASPNDSSGQFHVRNAVLSSDGGWVPVDPIGGICSKPNPDVAFGFFEGNFIAFGSHLDFCPEKGFAFP